MTVNELIEAFKSSNHNIADYMRLKMKKKLKREET